MTSENVAGVDCMTKTLAGNNLEICRRYIFITKLETEVVFNNDNNYIFYIFYNNMYILGNIYFIFRK